MFTVYHSNDIEILVRLGIHLMKSSATGNSSGNPFNPFHFIVQSNGMELYSVAVYLESSRQAVS